MLCNIAFKNMAKRGKMSACVKPQKAAREAATQKRDAKDCGENYLFANNPC